MSTINIQQLKAQCRQLDLSALSSPSDLEQAYFKYYGVDFENQIEAVAHYFGMLPAEHFALACHYYEQSHATKTVFIVHGLFDHVGLFGQAIHYFLRRGFNVVAFDLPGHGLSSGDSTVIDSFDDYGMCLAKVLDVFSQYQSHERYLLGQSTGGATILNYLLKQNPLSIRQALLFAPLVRPFGWHYLRFFYPAVIRTLNSIKRAFTPSCSNEAFLTFLKNDDPMQARELSIAWVKAMYGWLTEFEYLSKNSTNMLIIQGKKDITVDWKYNVPAIQALFDNTKTVYIKKANHHVVNESDSILADVFSNLDNYIL